MAKSERKNKMKTFNITKDLQAICNSERTRYGFRHLAELQYKGNEIATAKRCYYNRTWERYEFQSVLESLIDNAKDSLTTRQLNHVKKYIVNGDRVEDDLKPLKSISALASLGDIFGATQKDRNDFKTRILKAGLEGKGLIMPEGWDDLTEAEKEARLNGAISALQ
jgi:hypothetical protein